MSNPQILSVPVNAAMAWEIDAFLADQVTPYAASPSDALECVVWQGSDSAPLFSPSAAWITATSGKVKVSVTATQTATLTRGLYPVEVTTTPAATGQRLRLLDAWFEVTASPGASLQPPVYGTYQEMIDYGGGSWLDAVRRREGLCNFTRERARARSYLDDLIVRKFRAVWTTADWGPIDARNPTLRDYLAADYKPGVVLPNGTILAAGQTVLMVTDAIKEIVAVKALEYACRQRVTIEADDHFLNKAGYFRRLANAAIATTTAELDIDQDGLADYAFNLGVISTR